MEKLKKMNQKTENLSHCQRTMFDLLSNDLETAIRIGVKEASDEAIIETKKRKIGAPLTIEENIFLHFSSPIK